MGALTGLLNRRGFEAGLEQLASSLDATTPVVVLCLDVDGFTTVDARLGHGVRDADRQRAYLSADRSRRRISLVPGP